MNDDSSFLALVFLMAVIVLSIFGLAHVFSPKTDFTNQCIRHHGIPDVHTNTWVCNGVKYEPEQSN